MYTLITGSVVAMETDMYLVVVTWSTIEKEGLSVGGTTTVTMVTTRHIARQPANNETQIKLLTPHLPHPPPPSTTSSPWPCLHE